MTKKQSTPSTFSLNSIGTISSPFKEKFGIPRQPALAKNIISEIIITPPYNRMEAFKEIEVFSHLWLSFIFHQNIRTEWKPCIRPPRLGGNKKVGVFASRSSFRPNDLGLSVVELIEIKQTGDEIRIRVRGADLVDGTPIVDIKPYIPYTDAIPEAEAGYASEMPGKPLKVIYSSLSLEQLQAIDSKRYPSFKIIINDILSADPRPAYKAQAGNDKCDPKVYGIHLYDFNVKWKVTNDYVEVLSVTPYI